MTEELPEVKARKRQKICAKCGGAWPTQFKLNGVQLFECRRHAPREAERPGQLMYWRNVPADGGCAEWVQR